MNRSEATKIANKINDLIERDYGSEALDIIAAKAISGPEPTHVAIGRKAQGVPLGLRFRLDAETMEDAIAEYENMRDGTWDFEWEAGGDPPENVIDYLLDVPEKPESSFAERLDL